MMPPSPISLAVVPHNPEDTKMLDQVNRQLNNNTLTQQKVIKVCQSTNNQNQFFIVVQLKNGGGIGKRSLVPSQSERNSISTRPNASKK